MFMVMNYDKILRTFQIYVYKISIRKRKKRMEGKGLHSSRRWCEFGHITQTVQDETLGSFGIYYMYFRHLYPVYPAEYE